MYLTSIVAWSSSRSQQHKPVPLHGKHRDSLGYGNIIIVIVRYAELTVCQQEEYRLCLFDQQQEMVPRELMLNTMAPTHHMRILHRLSLATPPTMSPTCSRRLGFGLQVWDREFRLPETSIVALSTDLAMPMACPRRRLEKKLSLLPRTDLLRLLRRDLRKSRDGITCLIRKSSPESSLRR